MELEVYEQELVSPLFGGTRDAMTIYYTTQYAAFQADSRDWWVWRGKFWCGRNSVRVSECGVCESTAWHASVVFSRLSHRKGHGYNVLRATRMNVR